MSQDRLGGFKQNGFTIFEAAHPPELVARWLKTYNDLCRREGEAVWLAGTLEVDPELFLPAIANPEILDFAEAVMGPFVQLDSLAINAFPSVDPATASGTVNAWHRDRYSEIPVTRDYTHPLSCNTIFYLHDITDEYGPLRVIPGSHRESIVPELTWRHKPHADELLIYPKAGDVVFTHCNLLHSGTPNVSGRLRYFMSASYNRSFMRHRDRLDGPRTKALIEQARANGDRRLMRLLGVDEQLWDRCNPYWFTGTDEERWRAWIAEDRAAAGAFEANAVAQEHVHMAPSRRTMVAG